MSASHSEFPEHPLRRLLLGPFRGLDGLLVVLALPFGVLPRLAVVGLIQFLLVHAAIYTTAWKQPQQLALPALAVAWLGMLAVGRAWVKNEKHRSNIARKLVTEVDPDREPDLRLLALLSSLQVFVIFPLLFWKLSLPSTAPLFAATADPLFTAAAGTPWWHWPLHTLQECVSPFVDAGHLDAVFATEITAESDLAGTLIGVLRTTLEWLLFVGLLRLFAIYRTSREVVSDAALRNDNEMAVRLGRRALRPLVRHLRHPGEDVRIAAAAALGRIGRTRATRPLLRLFETDTSRDVREACAVSLGQIGDRRAVAPLVASLGDDGIRSAQIRNSVARALGQLGDDRAVLPLIGRLDRFQQDIDHRLRSATDRLFSEGSRFEVEYEVLVRDPDQGQVMVDDDGESVGTTRKTYEGQITTVGIDSQSGRGPYVRLHNEKFSERPYRSLSLVRIRNLRPLDERDDFSGSDVRHALAFVRSGLRDLFGDDQVIPALGRIGDRRAAARLAERIREADQLPVILWLGEGSPDVARAQAEASRESAILALQRIGDADSCEVMLEILRGDHSELLQHRAAVALAHLPGGPARLDEWLETEAPEAIRDGIRDSARNWWNQIDRDFDERANQLVVVDDPRTGRSGTSEMSSQPLLPTVPFTILVDREQLEVREIDGNRLSVVRLDEQGSPHAADAEIRLTQVPVTVGEPVRGGSLGRLVRVAAMLLLVIYGGVLLAHAVLPRYGYSETTVTPHVDDAIKTVHGLVSDVLPGEITAESLPFKAGLFLVPAVVILLGLLLFRRRRVTETTQRTGRATQRTTPPSVKAPTLEEIGLPDGPDEVVVSPPAPPPPEEPVEAATPRVLSAPTPRSTSTSTLRKIQPPSDEAVSRVVSRLAGQHVPASLVELVEETTNSEQKKVFTGMKPIEGGSGERFVVSPVAVVFDGPRLADGDYPIPESMSEGSLLKWVKRHPQVPCRSRLIELLHVYGLRLPTVAQAQAVFGSGSIDNFDLPIPVRDENTRLMMSDGRLVYAGDLDEPGASGSRLALLAVRELAPR